MPNSPASSSRRTPTKTQKQESQTAVRPADDLVDYLKDYAREKPEMAALWCFGIGFVLGWRLKPW